ncbi:ABC transporter ATP-binding protein [Brachybacterium sp. P6-10-X1]|uniref:energy-coupling factor ABC transporter ATP-binding protein n=1 Tax=Brachybacterium sp. P6-10-X1 TaxID=1903186 RepID=UPI0009718941|nr:ABC transporter ATP-binding protein [Brachybacterium sp. P6-10-X1]APX34002.1 ABC transporter ATP-binding protein [Brachybacterium sp. P6-10-X1]
MPLVSLEHVSYSYPNGFQAVDSVSFGVEAGESVAIIGQNGAGKTTTVTMINGLLRPTSGTVRIDGTDTARQTAAQTSRRVGYVFQNPDDQIFNPTVAKEVGYGLRRLKLSTADRDERVTRACEAAGLGAAMGTNPYDLPLSIRKFVAIASVLAADPEVVILDEPTAGQDLAGLLRLTALIDHLQQRGKAIITISHDMEFVAQNFDRVIVMADRAVVRDARADEIFYDTRAMDRASLRPPALAQVGALVGPEVGLDIDRLNAELASRSHAATSR